MATVEAPAPQKVITWTRPSTFGAPPSPRGGHTACLVGNLFVVIGGTRTDAEAVGRFLYLDDVWVLDTDSMRWHCPTLAGRKPPARYGHAAVVIDFKVYIFGGKGAGGALYNDVWMLDVERWTWQMLPTATAAPPAPRMGHAMVALGSGPRFLLCGGWDGSATFMSDSWVYDTASFTWSRPRTTGIPPSPRHGHSAVFDDANGRVLVFGGWAAHAEGYPSYQADARQLDVRAWTWSRVATTGVAPTARYAHAAAVIGNVMVLATGWSGPRDAAVVEAMLPTGSITLARPTAGGGGAAEDGGDEETTTLPYGAGDCYFLDMDSNEWVQPHIAGTPPLYRYGAALVAAGPAALLWGGWEGGRPMNDLMLLDLSALAAVVAPAD